FWSKDKGAEGVSEDSEGMRSLRRTLKKLIQTAQLVKRAALEEPETPAPETLKEEANKQ
ncbi:MAG TPA: flavodoxin family protein, partial [Methanosarcina sp.]|nr:flavodoxin family protein [Methanosarcina sp.]